jgi:hypothetical protein
MFNAAKSYKMQVLAKLGVFFSHAFLFKVLDLIQLWQPQIAKLNRNCKKVAISGGCLGLYVSYLRSELLNLEELGFSQVEILKEFYVNALLQTYCTQRF